jgi:hypothetical protein
MRTRGASGAQALGLLVRPTVCFQADEVIRQAAHRRTKIGRILLANLQTIVFIDLNRGSG